MNRHLSFIRGLAIVMMSALAGCAAVPMQEMSDARQALQAARAAEAGTHAAQRFGDAEQRLSRAERELANHYYTRARKDAVAARTEAISARNIALAIGQAKEAVAAAEREGAAAQGARELLAQAAAAAARLDEDEAVQAATHARAQALEDAERARVARVAAEQENQAWLDKAGPLLQQARAAEAHMNGAQHDRLIEADAAFRHGQGRHAYDSAAALTADLAASPLVAALPAPPTIKHYVVVRGDSLWKIAARAEAYGNPLWWPLLLNGNRARIADADLIRPGQELLVTPPASAAESARAEDHARRRGPWSIGKRERKDRDYLRGRHDSGR